MSFFGLGGEDWVGLDIDVATRSSAEHLIEALDQNRAAVEAAIGSPFDVERAHGGLVVVAGRRRYRAEVDRSGRLLFTGILDPDGPL